MKIRNLCKTYDIKNGEKVHALKGISFDLPSTGVVVILGKSGSGKSTLLNILGGLDSFDSGDIEAFGKNMKDFSRAELDNYRNSCISFVFQEYHLIPELNVGENIALALKLLQPIFKAVLMGILGLRISIFFSTSVNSFVLSVSFITTPSASSIMRSPYFLANSLS